MLESVKYRRSKYHAGYYGNLEEKGGFSKFQI